MKGPMHKSILFAFGHFGRGAGASALLLGIIVLAAIVIAFRSKGDTTK
jgi:hypothetical protein